ncbi:FlgD immunoglobulin-like domain containing protein [Herbiconiux sp. P17]|uniref:FlgD immunoglobulin-like domain containing protein n=1 Tax=Herbiconiux wuyangfengii TaxID=3342794 RepID=UPI0035B80DC8
MSYSVSPNAEVGYSGAGAALPTVPVSALKLDVRGDGTFNTLYVKLADVSGEVFLYRVGNLNVTSWTTATLDLRQAPASSSGGNANGVLDYPVSFYRVVVARNGSQPATGSVSLDNLRAVTDGWGQVASAQPTFSPGPGLQTSFSLAAGGAGDYSVVLKDGSGKIKSFSGTSSGAETVNLDWDGLGDSSEYLQGVVSAVLRYDATPGDGVDGVAVAVGQPNLLSVTEYTDGAALVEGFESPGSWVGAAGTASVAAASSSTEGAGALTVSYSVSPNAEVGYSGAGAALPTVPVSALKLDVRGDGTFNTLYVKLADVSGEVFLYRVGNLNVTSWTTATLDLRQAPASSSGGNANGVLDYPVSFYRVVVARNGSQPATGSVSLDNLRAVTDGWGQVASAQPTFSPGPGLQTSFSLAAGGAGDYSVVLKDGSGKIKSFSGTSSGAETVNLDWDGLGDSSEYLQGVVSAVLRYDATPGDGVDGVAVAVGQPNLLSVTPATSLSVRVESFDDGGGSWSPALGSVSVSPSPTSVEGSGAMQLDYNFAASTPVEVGKSSTPPTLPVKAYTSLSMSYRGDGSMNTLYVKLRDATGEVFMYRIGTLATQSWRTTFVDLSDTPVGVSGGNGNEILDAPIQLYRVVVGQNPGSAPSGTVAVDDMNLLSSTWGGLSVQSNVNRATGGNASISLTTGIGDYRLVLTDSAGRSKQFTGTASAASVANLSWNGKSDSSEFLQGAVRAELSFDDSAGNGLANAAFRYSLPYFSSVPARERPQQPASLIGVNSFLTTYDSPAAADADARLMEDAYVTYAREEFNWSMIEPKNNYYEFQKTDQAVAIASSRNINIVAKLFYTAPWATSAPPGTPADDARYFAPANLNEYASYVQAVVSRYKDQIHVWEVWNEPNIQQYWKPAPNASAYAAMLKIAYSTIKSVDPMATVLTAGFAGFDDAYMKGLVDAGAVNSFDGLAIHTYVDGLPETSTLDSLMSGAEAWMARNRPDSTLWITELGWSTCGSCSGKVSDSQQADYLSRAMLDALKHDVKGAMWFSLRELGDSTSLIDNYGLVTTAGSLKPSYGALKEAGASLYQMASGGVIAPTAGDATVVNDMATMSGMSLSMINGSTGSASISSSRFGGSGSVMANYSFPTVNSGMALSFQTPVPGEPSALSIWAFGDKSNSSVYLKFRDANGETFEAKVGNLATQKWERLTYYFDGGNPNTTSSGGDGVIDFPITVTTIHVYRSTSGVFAGQIFLDDLTAHYGDITRGMMLIGRNFNMQATYGLSTKTVDVPVARTPAYTQNGDSYVTLATSGTTASVSLGPRVKYVVNTLNVSAAVVAQSEPVSINWQGGDREKYTVQVIGTNGIVVRTLLTSQNFTSGRQAVFWDGMKSDGTRAAKGTYQFWLRLTAGDGTTATIMRPFTIQ